MVYLVGQMMVLLILALSLGVLVGWLLRGVLKKNELTKLEKTWKINVASKEQELELLQLEIQEKNKNIADLKIKEEKWLT